MKEELKKLIEGLAALFALMVWASMMYGIYFIGAKAYGAVFGARQFECETQGRYTTCVEKK